MWMLSKVDAHTFQAMLWLSHVCSMFIRHVGFQSLCNSMEVRFPNPISQKYGCTNGEPAQIRSDAFAHLRLAFLLKPRQSAELEEQMTFLSSVLLQRCKKDIFLTWCETHSVRTLALPAYLATSTKSCKFWVAVFKLPQLSVHVKVNLVFEI